MKSCLVEATVYTRVTPPYLHARLVPLLGQVSCMCAQKPECFVEQTVTLTIRSYNAWMWKSPS